MRWTSTVFLIAAVSMGGFPLLSGFWSKDAVLLAAEQRSPWLMLILLAGAVMTFAHWSPTRQPAVALVWLACAAGALR